VSLVLAGTVALAVPAGAAGAGGASPSEIPKLIRIPAGDYIAGSTRAERERAYKLDEAAYGHSVTRRDQWYENEPARVVRQTGAYLITRNLITNAQYLAFVRATGHMAPDVDAKTWKSYRLIHPYARTRRHAWRGGRPPKGREDHPVVMVSHTDARAYAAWLSKRTGKGWRLPR
jgi:formylglycine-generating enzyme required for sulfatase activity